MIQNLKTRISKLFLHHHKIICKGEPITDDVISDHDKKSQSHGKKIMVNCLKVDAYLKTVYKALHYDEDVVDGFCNDYLYILEEAIEVNWKNHVVGEDVSREEFHRLLNNRK